MVAWWVSCCGMEGCNRPEDTRSRDVTQANPMSSLYRRLSEVRLTRAYVRKTALPSWWDDEIAVNPTGYAQGLLLLSRHLGLELRSLQNEAVPVRLRDFGVCKYKKRTEVTEDELALARVMATRAAQLAAEAMPTPACPCRPAPGRSANRSLTREGPGSALAS